MALNEEDYQRCLELQLEQLRDCCLGVKKKPIKISNMKSGFVVLINFSLLLFINNKVLHLTL